MTAPSIRPPSTVNTAWALGYLAGRARAYRRGNVPIAAVGGAVRVAMRHEATLADIAAHLAKHGLTWDTEAHAVVPDAVGGQNAEDHDGSVEDRQA